MLAGAGAVLGIALAGGPRPILDDRAVAGLRATFEQLRTLGMQTSPAVILESLVTQTHTVHALARGNPEPVRSRLLLLAARMAEYTGWLSQEAGNEQDALSWTRHASELGRAGGDREIASYAYVREAGLALYRQDPIATIDLARQAQRVGRAGSRTFGLAARREAQGHALAGDRDAFERAMDRAAGPLYSSIVDTTDYPVLGSTAPDPLALARGWSLADLGRAGEAALLLGTSSPGTGHEPPHQGPVRRTPVTGPRTGRRDRRELPDAGRDDRRRGARRLRDRPHGPAGTGQVPQPVARPPRRPGDLPRTEPGAAPALTLTAGAFQRRAFLPHFPGFRQTERGEFGLGRFPVRTAPSWSPIACSVSATPR